MRNTIHLGTRHGWILLFTPCVHKRRVDAWSYELHSSRLLIVMSAVRLIGLCSGDGSR